MPRRFCNLGRTKAPFRKSNAEQLLQDGLVRRVGHRAQDMICQPQRTRREMLKAST